MKSFEDAMVEIFPKPIRPNWNDIKKVYHAGAEEMRKSMRCETCKHHKRCTIEIFGRDFGCVEHEERGTE